MLHKLYALVCGATVVDNPDALTHHEILLPGGMGRRDEKLLTIGQRVGEGWLLMGRRVVSGT